MSAAIVVITLAAATGLLLAGCGGSSSAAAVTTCVKGDAQGGGDDAYVATRVCPCAVAAYQKAGGDLRALSDLFQSEEKHISLNETMRDLRVAKALGRPGRDRTALKKAGQQCRAIARRAAFNDPNG